jgi:hypothetical protein
MENNPPLKLRVSRREDFAGLFYLLVSFCLAAALFSSHPAILVPLVMAFALVMGNTHLLSFLRPTDQDLTLIIFSQGQVRVFSETGQDISATLAGHHWCTQRVAVIGVRTGSRINRFVLLARQQDDDSFRRLRGWLKAGYFQGSVYTDVAR